MWPDLAKFFVTEPGLLAFVPGTASHGAGVCTRWPPLFFVNKDKQHSTRSLTTVALLHPANFLRAHLAHNPL